MAAKNKHRKKAEAANEAVEDNDVEAANGAAEEDEGQHGAETDPEEFSLEEVLRLGGTRVSRVTAAYTHG